MIWNPSKVGVAPQNIQSGIDNRMDETGSGPSLTSLSNATAPTATPSEKTPSHANNSELEKLHRLLYGQQYVNKTFWSTRRRRQLDRISVRIFAGSCIAAAVSSCLAILWYRYFSYVVNIYSVTLIDKNSKKVSAEITTSFIDDIKDAEMAFNDYIYGALLLFEGSLIASVAGSRSFKYRSWLYLIAILMFMLSMAFIVSAPLFAIMVGNSLDEIKLLREDEYAAYRKGYKGSIKFFKENQCDKIDEFVKTYADNKSSKKMMQFFCTNISRLVGFLYFMWFTALMPFVEFLFCWLQVIVNKKYWDMKTAHSYKPRTLEQSARDRSTSISFTPQGTDNPDMENLY